MNFETVAILVLICCIISSPQTVLHKNYPLMHYTTCNNKYKGVIGFTMCFRSV